MVIIVIKSAQSEQNLIAVSGSRASLPARNYSASGTCSIEWRSQYAATYRYRPAADPVSAETLSQGKISLLGAIFRDGYVL